MGFVIIDEQVLKDIANAVRAKYNNDFNYFDTELAQAVLAIPQELDNNTIQGGMYVVGADSIGQPKDVKFVNWGTGNLDYKFVMDIENIDARNSYFTSVSGFKNTKYLKSLITPSKLTTISQDAFYGTPIENVELNEGLEVISAWGFFNCPKLISIYIPDSVNTLGSGCFANCSELTSIHLPSSLKSMFADTFNNCGKLTEITVSDDAVFCYSLYLSIPPLSVDSMKRIITHLRDYSNTSTEGVNTITFKASSWANLDAEGATSPNGNMWREYIGDKGWKYA